MAQTMKGKEVTARVWAPGTGRGGWPPSRPSSSLGWVVAASRAEAAVVKEIRQALVPQALLILLVAVAAFTAVIVNAGPISQAIIGLRDRARALGGENGGKCG